MINKRPIDELLEQCAPYVAVLVIMVCIAIPVAVHFQNQAKEERQAQEKVVVAKPKWKVTFSIGR